MAYLDQILSSKHFQCQLVVFSFVIYLAVLRSVIKKLFISINMQILGKVVLHALKTG